MQPVVPYAQPVWNGAPAAAKRGGVNPLMLIAGLVVVAVIAGGAYYFATRSDTRGPGSTLSPLITPRTSGSGQSHVAPTPAPTPTAALPAAGGITFSPTTVDCSAPVDFTTTIALPSSVQSGDTVTLKFDGTNEGNTTVEAGGSTTLQPDGTWLDVSTESAADVQSICANGGKNDSQVGVLTTGRHVYQIYDSSSRLLAQGSYEVTGTASAGTPTPTPTAGPSQAALRIAFDPSTLSCSDAVDFQATITLPSSVKSGDTVSLAFDGTIQNTLKIENGGDWTQQSDGTWVDSSTDTASDVQGFCDNGGLNGSGVPVMVVGTHTMSILDANGTLLAEGSYTVN
jgi:hypothetical protein